MGDGVRRIDVQGVPYGDVAARWYGVPGHPQAVADVVAGPVVRDQPEEWRTRSGLAASGGPGSRRDGLDVAAHTAQGHGSTCLSKDARSQA